MKTLLIVALAVFLGSAPAGIVCADDIYWDPGEERDLEITPKDLPLKIFQPVKSAKSFAQLDVYDLGQSEPEEAEAAEPVVSAPIRPRTEAETPTYREPTTRGPRSGQDRQTVPQSRRERTRPAPAAQKPETKKEAPATTVTGETEKPDTKKMPWGKTEEPAAEPKKQLQWGKDK